MGLWIQAASAYAFGFHGWALLLPQAVAGVLSIAIVYHLVRRTFGPVAGLLATLLLAIMPIYVVTSCNNTADMLVDLTVLVAAWAVVRATETGSLSWLLLCALIVGLGFNIKMLQAFLVLPARSGRRPGTLRLQRGRGVACGGPGLRSTTQVRRTLGKRF